MVPFVFQSSNRLIQILWNDNRETHVFFDEDFDRGKQPYEAFWRLTEDAVETLTIHGLLSRSDLPADRLGTDSFEIRKSHYSRHWMLFVHQFAKSHPGRCRDRHRHHL